MESTVLELPLLAALLGGGLCSLLGYYVLRLGIATLAFTVAHAALAGAALSLTLGTDTTVTAMVVATVTAVLLGVVFARLEYGRDLVCMALFSLFNAVALLCIYLSNVQVLATVSLAEVLWGSVLTVTVPKVILLAGVTAAVILYVLAFKPQIDSMVFDKRLAEAEGVPVTLHTLLLLLATALAIAVVLRITGGFLTFTLLIPPPLAFHYFLSCNSFSPGIFKQIFYC